MGKFRSLLRQPISPVAGTLRDHSGATAVAIAFALTAVLGFAGLGTEAASWYYTKRNMQSAADAAAASAGANLAITLQRGGTVSSSQFTTDAQSIAAKYGFVNGSGSTTVTAEYPPSSGGYSGNNSYVAVAITQPQQALLSGLFLSSGPTISARAVAKGNSQAADSGCVMALNGASVSDVTLNGGVTMNFSGCALYDNSPLTSGNGALYMANNASLTASAVYVVGNANQTTSIHTTDGFHSGVNPAADPYSAVTMPTAASCNDTQQLNNPQDNASPNNSRSASTTGGTWAFCKDVRMTSNGSTGMFTLNPGIYIFACGANLVMTSGTLSATGGVTLVFERACPTNPPGAGTNPGIISVTGNSNLSITAPTSGSTAGLAIFQERYTCTAGGSNCDNSLSGGGTLNITGAAYFPNNPVNYSGGTAGGGTSQCTQLIASTISFSGNPTFNSNCTDKGTKTISYTQGWLAE